MKHRIRLFGLSARVILLLAGVPLGTSCSEPDTVHLIDAFYNGLQLTFPGKVEQEDLVGGWVYTWSGIQSTPEDGSADISHIDIVVGDNECGEADTGWTVDGVELEDSSGGTLRLVGVYSIPEGGESVEAEAAPVALPSNGPIRIRVQYEDDGLGMQREAVLLVKGNFPKTLGRDGTCTGESCSCGPSSCAEWTDAPDDQHLFGWCFAGADLPMDGRFLERIRIVVPGS